MTEQTVLPADPDPSRPLSYGLRTCNADLTSYGGFQWPEDGHVACPDWSPVAECGHGLHMLHEGKGSGGYLDWSPDAKWLVISYYTDALVDIGGKGKVPEAWVLHVGDRLSATMALAGYGHSEGVVGGTSTSGHGGTSTSGERGTSTSGDRGTSTSGYGGTSTSGYGGTSTSGHGGTSTSGDRGTSTSGDGGTSTSGYGGTSTSGDRGTSTSGYGGTSTSGDRGTSTSGYGGTSTSGYGGTSTSGDRGTSTSGDRGTSTSGDGGTSTSGYGGIIVIRYWDDKASRYRLKEGYVGEDGIKPNVPYCCENGKLVEVRS